MASETFQDSPQSIANAKSFSVIWKFSQNQNPPNPAGSGRVLDLDNSLPSSCLGTQFIAPALAGETPRNAKELETQASSQAHNTQQNLANGPYYQFILNGTLQNPNAKILVVLDPAAAP